MTITIDLSNELSDRLFTIKEQKGYNNMTANEFAEYLLEIALYSYQIDDSGRG